MLKVLILDDDLDILDATGLLLSSKNYDVLTASNSEDFFTRLIEFHPDIVIIDILLQGNDGRQVSQKLRQDPANKYLCILVFSASPTMMHDFKSYGIDACLEKPFDIKNLVEKIEYCYAQKKQ